MADTIKRSPWVVWIGCCLLAMAPTLLFALQPPARDQWKSYAEDGTLAKRIAAAMERGNHKTDPMLVWLARQRILKAAGASDEQIAQEINAPPPAWRGGLPSSGTPKTLVLMVDFPDYPHVASQTQADVQNKFFGSGDAGQYPYESLRNYYQRSSYNQLTVGGNVLGWYRATNNRSYYEGIGNGPGQEALMMEALNYFNAQGHDFTQYDNDGNGTIDAFFIKWTGPDNGWANFWWAYQWVWHSNPSYRIDGKALGKYVWSWISNPAGGVFQPHTDIHETGHLLGLPDLYDYDDSVGPRGGVGNLDMMDANWGDHNCFSKFMLGWLTPTTIGSGSDTRVLNPTGTSQDCVLIMPGASSGLMFSEFFMAQYRRRSTGNDPSNYPTDGLTIWHIDSTLDGSGNDFLYDNSYTAHKLVRLMEADGLEQIEQNISVNAGDFYVSPKTFGPGTVPNSRNYASSPTNVQVDQLTAAGSTMGARFTIVTQPLVSAAGSTLTAEGCPPPNGALDPGETVTVSFSLQNVGTGSTTNLVATLQSLGGVTSPSGPQTYGVLTAGGAAVARPFSFTANGAGGGTLVATLQLQDGATNLGTVTFSYTLGTLATALAENFDGVSAPGLPSGWVATPASGSVTPWVTATGSTDTAPNAAFASDPSTVTDNWLDSPSIPIATATARLTFRHNYSFETGYDGGVLEIAVGAGSFTDIITAGGSFVTGGYVSAISSCCGNPLAGRQAWTAGSGGFITTAVNLPASAAGNNIRLRWRLATDSSVSDTGWRVDTVSIGDGYSCCTQIVPRVTAVTVLSGSTVSVTFSEEIGNGATNPANYTLSGTGKGTLAAHPDSVVQVSGTESQLTWNAGEMHNGGDVVVCVDGVQGLDGDPIGEPKCGTHTGGGLGTLPTVATVNPARGASVYSLPTVQVTFSEVVTGVTAGALTVNGSSATMVNGSGAGPYTFAGYALPSAGTAGISLGAGLTADLAGNGFAGDGWTVTVTATVASDFDKDGDVDLEDFGFFRLCFSGPNHPAPYPECSVTDLDGDADVDLEDFAIFRSCFNGPNRSPACL